MHIFPSSCPVMILFFVPKIKIEIFPNENLIVLGKYNIELFLLIFI